MEKITGGTGTEKSSNGKADEALAARRADLRNTLTEGKFGDYILNQLISRAELIRKHLDPRRSVDDECGYPVHELSPREYMDLYNTNPVAARVVEVWPEECWQVQPSIFEDSDPSVETPFEIALQDLNQSLHGENSWFQDEEGQALYDYMKKADKISRIGKFGVILIGIDDGKPLSEEAEFVKKIVQAKPKLTKEPEEDPDEATEEETDEPPDEKPPATNYIVPMVDSGLPPVPDQLGGSPPSVPSSTQEGVPAEDTRQEGQIRKLLFLRVLPQTLVSVVDIEKDRTSTRYGQPTKYKVTMSDPSTGTGTIDEEVHWTRIVHIPSDEGISDELYGAEAMKIVLHPLLDIKKLLGGSAEMYWLGAFGGIALETHPHLGKDDIENPEELKDMMEKWAMGLQRWFALLGMSAKSLAPQVVDPTPQIKVQIDIICIKITMPVRVFMGSERGELASSQDDASWNDRVAARQRNRCTPRIVVPLINRFISLGCLPQPVGYSVLWPDITSQSVTEKTTWINSIVMAMKEYVAAGLSEFITPHDFLTRILDFDDLEAQDIIDAAEELAAKEEKEAAAEAAERLKKLGIDPDNPQDPQQPPQPGVDPNAPPNAQPGNPIGQPGGIPRNPPPPPGGPIPPGVQK